MESCKTVVKYADHSKGFECITVPMPGPVPPEHLLIKVLAAPIDVIDEPITRGEISGVPRPSEPFPLGIEGAGIVLDVGANVGPDHTNCKGKKVAFYRGMKLTPQTWGAWSQYAVIHYSGCILLDDSADCEEQCDLAVNGLTAFGMLDTIKRFKSPGTLNTAAASSVGKKFISLCAKENIELVNVVRGAANVAILKSLGAKHVLDQTAETFQAELKELCGKLNVQVGFDCVCGDLTAKICTALPPHGTLYLYGYLAGPAILSPKVLVFGDKTLKGFHMNGAECMKDPTQQAATLKQLAIDAKAGVFKTHIAQRFKLEQCKEAMAALHTMASQGKVIFTPHSA